MASHTMTIAALGRPFTLGMLYDAWQDEMIPGSTLWDTETLKKNTTEKPQKTTNFNISKDDSIESKSSLLDVGASLKASFLSGLIEVGGSAKYLNDTKKSKNQSRVTCQYKTTTNFRELSVNQLASMTRQQIDNIDKGCATHVVTGILYGANAFFVFDSEKLDDSSVQDIQGSMEAVIKKIPKLNIEGKVDMKLTNEEKALTDKFSCKFYGDFILESNPATFEEAVKTYVDLPKLLGVNGENSVPLTVWLMPLKNWDPKAPELMSGISDELVGMAQDALEDLKQMVMRCNDALDEKVAKNFPPIKKKLSIFKKACEDYAAKLKQTMKKEFPLIREGKDGSSVKQVFEDRDKSPFSQEKLGKWMDHKESEIKIIKPIVEKGTKIVLNQPELDREVVAADVEDALCFVFTSLESDEPCLDVMTKYLNSSNIECTHEELWRLSKEAFDKMSEKADVFQYLAKALKNNSRFCFLIAAIENKKHTGATIYHYREGKLVSEDFSKPGLPPVEQITDKQNLIWYARDLTLDPNTVNGYLTLSEEDKKATYGAWQSYPNHPERFDLTPQVMCKERLKGRHYWEVDWSVASSTSVYIGVAHKGIERKTNGNQSQLGNNAISWCFGQYNSSLYKYHGGSYEQISFPSGCSRVGVFLDWPAGTLSYYSVSSNSLSHLYTFKTTFTEPVYPCFWLNKYSNYVYLRLTD